ncbi:Outer membrane protein assembly factor YaeT precursor [hydrothermal vent metagenome]|uniref:Outer membrane protein assembly factor YaeT n=1 Tax=hydrothermal vent metagenome TaxID=652676 RepID=A0A1W1BJD3_9ZZZZ
MIKKIAFVWLLIGSLLLAQKITQIKFEGLAHLSPSVAKEVAGIHVGDQMDSAKINQSIKNFFNQGYFKDVWVDKKGGILIYHFKEKAAIANLEIKGYGTGDDGKKLLKSIGLKKGDLYDEARIKRAKKTLISRLESKGNYDSVVEVKTTPVGKGAVSVVFNVNKGEKIKIKKLNFIGASALSKSELETSLANQEEDFLGWLPFLNSGDVKVDQLEYDAYRVKDTYMKHGYLDAYVSKPLMRVDYSSYSAEIDYQVKEGDQYRVGQVSVAQDIDGLDSEALANDLSLKKGRIFNISKMRKDMKMLQEAAGNKGYAYAKVLPRMHKNPEDKTIDLQYVIQPGMQVTVNDVLISGNDSTKDRVIRRYIYLAPGDTFNATDLKDSKNALGRTGFFEKVDIQSQRISADKINLLVKVKETATGTISAGGGYGSYEGLMLNASVSDKNLFGSGINGSVGFDISKISTNYNLSFTNPRLWDSLYSLGFNVYKKKYEYYNFTQDQTGGSLMLGREFLRHFHASVGVGYVDNKSEKNDKQIVSSDGNVTFYDRYGFYNDKYKKTSLFFNLSFDNTDDYYVPREGMIAAVNVEYASLDGDDFNATAGSGEEDGYGTFIKTAGKLGLYYGLNDWIDYDLILRFKARATVISSGTNEKLPIGEKLYMGGIGSVRGYDPYSLTPLKDPNDLNSRIGGKKRASATVEASIPLSEAAKMRLAFFYDYGMIGEDSFTEIKRSSAGAVIEWQSAFGPINLVFAKAINPEAGDRTSTFEFSMGTKF